MVGCFQLSWLVVDLVKEEIQTTCSVSVLVQILFLGHLYTGHLLQGGNLWKMVPAFNLHISILAMPSTTFCPTATTSVSSLYSTPRISSICSTKRPWWHICKAESKHLTVACFPFAQIHVSITRIVGLSAWVKITFSFPSGSCNVLYNLQHNMILVVCTS